MYRRNHLRFLFSFGLAFLLLIVALIFILLHGNSTSSEKLIAGYAKNPSAYAAMLIDGPVNAPSQHNQVLVVVSNSVTKVEVFSGYSDNILRSATYPMDESAFHVFLRSLEYAGYTEGSNNPDLRQASGYCPTGDRYIFSFGVNGKQILRYWTTDCGGTHTYDGNLQLTLTLFQAQVPQYNQLTTNLNI